jgi:hypothetical protein
VAEPDTTITVGDRVRAYDFPQFGRHMPDEVIQRTRDCYAEGVVEAIGEVIEGCPRYRIHVEKNVFAGSEFSLDERPYITPPVNGTQNTFGGVCAGVEKIA